MPAITPCLWLDGQAEEAADHYLSIFPNSRIVGIGRWPEDGPGTPGAVLTVEVELDGRRFVLLDGGPQFSFTEAVSFQIHCRDQDEVDHYWDRLGEGGEESMCGWLKDRFGLSWQVVPDRLRELLAHPDPQTARRAMEAMLDMRKIDVAALEDAAAGARA